MEDYTPNSHKFRKENKEPEKKKLEKVVSGNVKSKKKNEIWKLADVFISEDVENVKSYILMDVLVPSVKKAISDIVTNGIDMILYGDTSHSKRNSPASRVSYRSYYNRDRDRHSARTRSGYAYEDVILESRGEAEEVLVRMDELMDTYGIVSVSDFYELVGISSNYTDNKYGWTDIRSAKTIRTKDGYMIKMPRAMPLD
jgi:hypothetical protein